MSYTVRTDWGIVDSQRSVKSKNAIFCRYRVPIKILFSGHKLPICDCYHSELLSTHVRRIEKYVRTALHD